MTPVAGVHLQGMRLEAHYHENALHLYREVLAEKPHTLLLESAECGNNNGLSSLLLARASLQIHCMERRMAVKALSAGGLVLLKAILPQFPGATLDLVAQVLNLEFPKPPPLLDEQQRLAAASPLDFLRLLQLHLRDELDESCFFLGGAFAFDLVSLMEELPEVPEGNNPCPDICFYLAECFIRLDHTNRRCEICALAVQREGAHDHRQDMNLIMTELRDALAIPGVPAEAGKHTPGELQSAAAKTAELRSSCNDQDYERIVRSMQDEIGQGEIFQVVPARAFELPCKDPLAAYAELRQRNPSPYMFYMNAADFVLFGASPESALKYSAKDRRVELYPIAGTRARGRLENGQLDHELDMRIERELREDRKELAEHLMLVDLARNDLARICETGSRRAPALLKVDRYSHVMHLVSIISGTLRPELDALHAYQACMNMGTLTGAPKARAAALIRQCEQQRRGSYGGAVGWLDGAGNMDTCIVIRSACVSEGTAVVQAGAGIVHDSIPRAEAAETRQKAAAVLESIILASRGSAQ